LNRAPRRSADDAVEEDLLLRVRLDHESADVQQPEHNNCSHDHRRDPAPACRHEALGGNQQQGRIDEEHVAPAVVHHRVQPDDAGERQNQPRQEEQREQVRGADGIAGLLNDAFHDDDEAGNEAGEIQERCRNRDPDEGVVPRDVGCRDELSPIEHEVVPRVAAHRGERAGETGNGIAPQRRPERPRQDRRRDDVQRDTDEQPDAGRPRASHQAVGGTRDGQRGYQHASDSDGHEPGRHQRMREHAAASRPRQHLEKCVDAGGEAREKRQILRVVERMGEQRRRQHERQAHAHARRATDLSGHSKSIEENEPDDEHQKVHQMADRVHVGRIARTEDRFGAQQQQFMSRSVDAVRIAKERIIAAEHVARHELAVAALKRLVPRHAVVAMHSEPDDDDDRHAGERNWTMLAIEPGPHGLACSLTSEVSSHYNPCAPR
jgi:hypothetical protein